MATITVTPEQQIQNTSDTLSETEYKLERAGVDVHLLRTWLTQTLLLRELQEQHRRGELQAFEGDEEDYY